MNLHVSPRDLRTILCALHIAQAWEEGLMDAHRDQYVEGAWVPKAGCADGFRRAERALACYKALYVTLKKEKP